MNVATRHDLELPGCTPEPLMNYLKALGVMRLVSKQKDCDARGWWTDDFFFLRSTLDRNALVKFFLEEYNPTPIMSPWAGGSGFFSKDNKEATASLHTCESQRAIHYSEEIGRVSQIIKELQIKEKPRDEEKVRLISRYRRELADEVVGWMDAAMVVQAEGQAFSPLLGTGGNDGRLDFTQNFMKRLVDLGLHTGNPPNEHSRACLCSALFGTTAQLDSASVGQFAPGRSGGPNATQGMEGSSTDNPWDFILMLEGTLLLGGAAARRYGVSSTGRASYPFTVRTVAAGFDSAAKKDEADSRGELWLPIWPRPTSSGELVQLFGEGRAEISGRTVRDGVDFARAVAGVGVDRGIKSFNRFAFLKRSGKAFLATPLGSFQVEVRGHAELLQEVDPWLDRFRRAAGETNAPPRFGSALRAIDSAIFDFCKYGGGRFFQRVLIALGAAERELALTAGKVGQSKTTVPPLSGLSSDWIDAANDDSPEFVIALALACIHDPQSKVGPLRANLEPVDCARRYPSWAEKDRAVVWSSGDLTHNLASVLTRRVMDGERVGCEQLPLAPLRESLSASTGFISAFLRADIDDRKIENLLWGLMLVVLRSDEGRPPNGSAALEPIYCLLKLLFLHRPLSADRSGQELRWRFAKRDESGIVIRPETTILSLLRAGRVGEAAVIAMRRLRASGLTPLPHRSSSGVSRDREWREVRLSLPEARRLAAALLIPIHPSAVNDLVHTVTRADTLRD